MSDALFELDAPQAHVGRRRPRRKADRLAHELSETAHRLADAAKASVPNRDAATAAYRLVDQLVSLAWPATPTGFIHHQYESEACDA